LTRVKTSFTADNTLVGVVFACEKFDLTEEEIGDVVSDQEVGAEYEISIEDGEIPTNMGIYLNEENKFSGFMLRTTQNVHDFGGLYFENQV
jgi:hypothetical protein